MFLPDTVRLWPAARLGPGRDRPHDSGADRDRTDDLRLAKPALSQLSYSPVKGRCLAVGDADSRAEAGRGPDDPHDSGPGQS